MGTGGSTSALARVNSLQDCIVDQLDTFLGESCDSAFRGAAARSLTEEETRASGLAAAMVFPAWPPWRPGVLFTGDSLGAGKPASGAGSLQGS